jgi:microcystin degradation protein MlrC
MEAAAAGYLDISVMAGFSYADAPNTGFSVVAVSGEGQQTAQAAADQLSQRIWADRAELYRPERIYSVDEAVSRAMAQAHLFDKPIVLLEHADRLNDSTYLLAELIARDAQNVGIPFLWDSEAALAAHAAGSGARIRLEIGGLSSDKAGPRLAYDCEVLQSGPITYRISGQMLQGQKVDLGMTALVRIGGVTVSLVSNFAFGVDEDAFRVFGQDPRAFDIIVLRSKTHFRQVYEELSAEILIVDTPDYGPADVCLIPYEKLDTSDVYPFCAAR